MFFKCILFFPFKYSLKLIQESFKNENECDRPPEFLGIFYELYNFGNINVKDDVFLHISQNDL